MNKALRYVVIFIFGTMLIIFSSIFLRHLCVMSLKLCSQPPHTNNYKNFANFDKKIEKNTIFFGKKDVFCKKSNNLIKATAAENNRYFLINQDITLHSNSTLSDSSVIMMLPKGYYLDILTTHQESPLAKVSYNGVSGFISTQNVSEVSTIYGSKTQKPEATAKADAGTYLRKSPNTTEPPITLVTGSSPLTFLGYTYGEVPLDGITNIWYLVTFDTGPTTTHYGYIYSERVNLSHPLLPQDPSKVENATTTQTTLPLSPESLAENLTGKINLSSSVKWFLIVLFSVLAVIIFLLLLISPKKVDKQTSTPTSKTPNAFAPTNDTNPTNIRNFTPALNKDNKPCNNSSKNFCLDDTSQNKRKIFAKKAAKGKSPRRKKIDNKPMTQYIPNAETETAIFGFSENKAAYPRIKRPSKAALESNHSSLPPYITRYFNITPTSADPGDELL